MDEHDGGDTGASLRRDDLWQGAAGAGLWIPDQDTPWGVPQVPGPRRGEDRLPEADASGRRAQDDRAAVYLEVQGSPAFQDVRDRYRRFAFPVAAAFLAWYLLYVVAAITAPGLMAHQVAGELNVALAAGLAQFATTFLLTWAYARHARLRRDRAALELRWNLATRTGQERVR